ncbi:MAG: TonB-dependent receptor [Sphingomonadaceae bacterium]|uniref:TonB-dependent receptor n=1 Tax=Thermaurantiacus sp. TaxID=2820283 RepID=UPI00298F1FAA|nr:TonB-dependent receptor [Thermaurantiacus sp.]MCS6985905.1 TonB-dependent receptor [Sphingomonadaceae bacterium]MDW8414879.1 TonB-dependent receptor [Thermaurantiacus sp.]
MRRMIQFASAAAGALVPAAAASQPVADAGAAATEIVVFGRGQIRQVAEAGPEAIRLEVPGASPFKAIDRLPGVNFHSADPFGVYEWSTRITLRGFNQNQLGFTLDGVPLGDMSYGNNNGLHISRAIISDNIAVTRVSQGAGALATASTSNLGGTIEFVSRDPSDELAMDGNATYGASNTVRLFARVDSGRIGPFAASVSYAFLDAGKWKGDGAQRHHQANLKVVGQFGERFRASGFLHFSDRRENDYQDLSLEMIRRLGYRWDNFAPNWDLAVRVAQIAQNRGDVAGPPSNPGAGTVYPAPIRSVDDSYYDASGLRRDWLASIGLEFDFAPVTLRLRPYWHQNDGQGIWYTPYVATPGGAPISVRTTEYDIQRGGLLADVAVRLGRHALSAGVWFEDNDFVQGRRFYGLANTTGRPSRQSLKFKRDPFRTQWRFDFDTKTVQYFLQDRFELSDALVLNAGVKGNRVRNRSERLVPGTAPAAGEIESADWFMPQVGVLWRFASGQEAFFSYTENRRAFTSAATGISPFATSQVGFNAIRDTLRPETSRTFEGGLRFAMGALQGVAAAYLVNFRDRLLAIPIGPGIVGNPVVLQNVGRVKSRGIELGAAWRPLGDLVLNGSYAFNRSTYEDDVVNAGGQVLARTRGKQTVDTPKHLTKLDIAWDAREGLFGQVGINHASRRFFTFENDQSVPGRVLVDATVGWRFAEAGPILSGLEAQLSVTNLFDKEYVATIGSNGFGNRGDNQTLLAGAPRQWFVTLRKRFP